MGPLRAWFHSHAHEVCWGQQQQTLGSSPTSSRQQSTARAEGPSNCGHPDAVIQSRTRLNLLTSLARHPPADSFHNGAIDGVFDCASLRNIIDLSEFDMTIESVQGHVAEADNTGPAIVEDRN